MPTNASSEAAPAAPGRPPRATLRRRYAGIFVLLVSLPLLADGLVTATLIYRQQREALAALQLAQAETSAVRIQQFLREVELQLAWLTALPWSAGAAPQRRLDVLRTLRQAPAITDLVLLDGQGRERVAESRLAISRLDSGADRSVSPAFAGARAHGSYRGDVTFRKGSEPFLTLAVAGPGPDGSVAIAEVNLKFIWDVVSRIRIGQHGLAYVLDRAGRLIAHPDINLVLRNSDFSDISRAFAAAPPGPGPATALQLRGSRGAEVLASSVVLQPTLWRVVVEQPIDEADAPLWAAARGALWVAAAGLLLALGAALWSAWRLTQPLRVLAQGAQRIGAGELSHRIALSSGDELQQLGERFNAMAVELQASYGSLERQVQARTRELSEANQAKSRLLAAASHDLRQPLHALNLMVAQWQLDPAAAQRQGLAARIAQAIDAINALFDGLLDVSKLDAGVVTPQPQALPLQQVLDRMDLSCAAAARAKGLDLRIRACAGWTHSDPVLLDRIVGNLVGNALRYTRQGGVLLGCRRTTAGWRLAVWDTGIGIAPDEQARIFDEFYRAPGGGAAAPEGLGLGLSIVARLAALLGHGVHLRSVAGRGSCFSVDLPAVPAQAAPPAAEPALGDALQGRRVLVVDNHEPVLHGTVQLLRGWGCSVQGLPCLPSDLHDLGPAPDLLLVDLHLDRGDDGVAVAERLRAHFGRALPTLVMTGDVTRPTRERIAAAGLPQLEKPLSALRLRSALTRLLARG